VDESGSGHEGQLLLEPPTPSYPGLVHNLLSLVLDHVPVHERPTGFLYSRADTIKVSLVSQLLAELDAIEVDESSPVRRFHDILPYFVNARMQLLSHLDKMYLIGAEASQNEGLPEVVGWEQLQIQNEEAGALFRTSLAYFSGYFGSKALLGLGLSPNHLQSLGRPDLAGNIEWERRVAVTHPQEELPADPMSGCSPFTAESLPVSDYADLVQLVFALCLSQDTTLDQLPDYGVSDANLRGQQLGSHLRRLWGLRVRSSDLRPVHQAVCDYIFARDLRGACRRAMALSSDPDERRLYADRLRASRIAEISALRFLRFTLKRFADRFDGGTLGLIGIQPSVLSAIGLGVLALRG
jgi:hypothetical protein